jgi:hydroxyacylglutathione hydrolase
MTQMTDGLVDFASPAPTAGSLDVTWIHGVPSKRSARDPKIQVHAYDEHTIILRQSKSVSYEAPFLYLLFGNDRVLLLDTGATADPGRFPLRDTVDRLISQWLDNHPRARYELVVAHTHGHSDHVAGDAQFAGRPDTTVIGRDVEAVQQFFGFTDWPEQIVKFDLGGRVLEITGSPGHHRAAITIYDPWSGFLLTGDTVLPGRLYVDSFPLFLASLDRMVRFAESRAVTHVLGCHVEMTNQPGRDYPLGATYQPDERALQMTTIQLTTIRDAAASIVGKRGVHRFDDVIIYNEPGKTDLLKLIARGAIHKTSAAVSRH